MSYGKLCGEPGCKKYATHSVHVMKRSTTRIKGEGTGPLQYACNEHKRPKLDDLLPPHLWDLLVQEHIAKNMVPPVKTVCFVYAKEYEQPREPEFNGLSIVK